MTDRSPALGFLTFGRSFADAADRLRQIDKHDTSAPVYYLYGHAIELMLKAFLRARGFSVKQVKKLGHNLQAVLEAAESEGLAAFVEIAGAQRTAILILNSFYSEKKLEYITTGIGQYPDPSHLSDAAKVLYAGLKKRCYDHTTENS